MFKCEKLSYKENQNLKKYVFKFKLKDDKRNKLSTFAAIIFTCMYVLNRQNRLSTRFRKQDEP